MGWKYPRHRIESGDPASIDDLNENFYEISQESGGLNEHNFQLNAISSRTALTKGSAYRIKHFFREADPTAGGAASALPTSATNGVDIDTSMGYQEIADVKGTITTEESLLWILGSCQTYATDMTRIQIGIRVNDVVIPESVTGGTGTSNDPYGFGPQFTVLGGKDGKVFTTEAVVPVPAGKHQVALVVSRTLILGGIGKDVEVQNRELIVIELRR